MSLCVCEVILSVNCRCAELPLCWITGCFPLAALRLDLSLRCVHVLFNYTLSLYFGSYGCHGGLPTRRLSPNLCERHFDILNKLGTYVSTIPK